MNIIESIFPPTIVLEASFLYEVLVGTRSDFLCQMEKNYNQNLIEVKYVPDSLMADRGMRFDLLLSPLLHRVVRHRYRQR